jgi:hypothetical protein
MQLIAIFRRLIEAVVTGMGVVFGLTPDPSLVPVERDELVHRR